MGKEKERYDPNKKERYWQEFWERKEIYRFNPEKQGPIYTVDTPPPTISGSLHLGHIFSYIQAEVIARFKRMDGSNIRYPQGFDSNGLPTEKLVEKEIGKKGQDMKFEEFTKACSETTAKYKKIYKDLWRSIGLSVDWRLEYSTISPEVQKIAQSAFKNLYKRNIIYKKNAPALYCTECRTSFAQAEKEDKETHTIFFYLKFMRGDGLDLIISTTRPELLPACVAVFVNPRDARFKNLIGKKVKTPLGNEVPVLADEKVELEKGSGAVMCCTYGDETDIYWTKTYSLSERVILGKDGKLQNVNEMPELNGMTLKIARKLIIENLKKENLVEREENIKHNVGIHERCGTPIEFLPTTQWFVKILEMKDELLKAGDRINWHPAYMKKRYEEWISNLKWDWCISRERFYGIPIPAFSCDHCDKIFIPDEKEFPVDQRMRKIDRDCPYCQNGKLNQEKDVLDTWFTSSLTPDINNIHEGSLKGKLYPMSVRPMGHDIIRTWAVYTILISLYLHNEIPWENLMISGHTLLRKGEKISKKTGTGKYKPEDLIAKESADAVRYAMLGAILGKDSYFEEGEVQKGKKLVTKIYNAGKLVLSKLQDFDPKNNLPRHEQEAFDKWIIRRCAETSRDMRIAFLNYEYAQARRIFEQFFWSEFCDNYLEIAKSRLSIGSDEKEQESRNISIKHTIYHIYLAILKMASPFIPHITEEMYHMECIKVDDGENISESFESESDLGYFYRNEGAKSIHNTNWPSDEVLSIDHIIEGSALALYIISKVRKFKTINNIKFGMSISSLSIRCTLEKQDVLKPFLQDIACTVRAQDINLIVDTDIVVLIEV